VRLAELRGRSVAVWGSGREGRAAVRAVAAHDPLRLIAVDDSANFLSVPWSDEPAPLAGGDHAFGALVAAEVVVRSPEIPQTHPWLAEVRRRGITVTSGSALWMADHAGRTIAVTGSKGKTTTASLVSHLLTAVGRPHAFGGDSGVPLLDLPPAEQYVVAVSSRVCADLADSPRVAVVSSLFAEHPEAHGGEREYYRDTLNLLAHGPELIVINGKDDRLVTETLAVRDANGFAAVPAGGGDSRFRIDADDLVYCSDDPLFPRTALRLRGRHNGHNLCVALAVLDGLGIDVVAHKDALAEAVAAVEGLPHRLTEFEDPSGLLFVDDILSTTPFSAVHSIDAYEGRPLTVLMGGADEGLDYAPLREHLRDRELTVIGLPDSGPQILAELAGLPGVRTEPAEDLPAAVRLARKLTPPGGVVLLSPAAPRHGRFRDVEHRSEIFLRAVRDSA
jgi:UDP-N-acetylmuramoylalanine--D-glutamate ligase